MATIKFKATKKKHSSGYAILEKEGDLQYDMDKNSKDGIRLYMKNGEGIIIDCDFETRKFNLYFPEEHFKVYP